MMPTIHVRFLALHIGCDACGATARIAPDCDLFAIWATDHMLPRVIKAEVMVDGKFTVRALRAA